MTFDKVIAKKPSIMHQVVSGWTGLGGREVGAVFGPTLSDVSTVACKAPGLDPHSLCQWQTPTALESVANFQQRALMSELSLAYLKWGNENLPF